MKKNRNSIVLGVAVFAFMAAAALLGLPHVNAGGVYDGEVDVKKNEVKLNDRIEYREDGSIKPESEKDELGDEEKKYPAICIDVGDGWLELTSLCLEPPTKPVGYKFLKFPEPIKINGEDVYTHVDLYAMSVDGFQAERIPGRDTPLLIQVKVKCPNNTAANFPLRAEGNLGSPGGSPATPHWSVKTRKEEPQLIIYVNERDSSDDDYVFCCEDGASVTVELCTVMNDSNKYTVSLSHTGPGNISYSTEPVELDYFQGEFTTSLNGLQVGDVTITANCTSSPVALSASVTVPVIPDLKVKTKRVGTTEWSVGGCDIAAGGINSYAHKADVLIEAEAEVALLVTLIDGEGHTSAKNAKLVIGGVTITPGQTETLTTNTSGQIEGVLTSSDVLDGATIEVTKPTSESKSYEPTVSAYVSFGWDNYDSWESYEVYSIPGANSTQTVTFKRNGAPLSSHSIKFFVEEVQYEDENGVVYTLTNTPDNPSDLSEWASFETPSLTTDINGVVTATLITENRPEIVSITMGAYDMGVWEGDEDDSENGE